MVQEELSGATADVECIGHAMRESAHYEDRNAEEQRPPVAIVGSPYGCGHNETASYRKHPAAERPFCDSCGYYAFS